MAASKSVHNACPACGLPRGKGPHEFAHVDCLSIRAKTEGNRLIENQPNARSKITEDQRNTATRKSAAKKYLSGKKLPGWMFD